MIHIIKKGTKERTVYRVECPECGCEYEYDKQEILREKFGKVDIYHTLCPQCGETVKHYSTNIDFSKLRK